MPGVAEVAGDALETAGFGFGRTEAVDKDWEATAGLACGGAGVPALVLLSRDALLSPTG